MPDDGDNWIERSTGDGTKDGDESEERTTRGDRIRKELHPNI